MRAKNMLPLNSLEKAVLNELLAGEHSVLVTLREQLKVLSVLERTMTGSGFFTRFFLPLPVPSLPLRFEKLRFGDVKAKMPELEYGAGFLLFLEKGYLDMLEGFSYEEPWPENIKSFE